MQRQLNKATSMRPGESGKATQALFARPTVVEALLLCGIATPLLYIATDVIASLRWDGYSYRDQTISELAAIGAPTRPLAVTLLLADYILLSAFGVGVWVSAHGNPRLRVTGAALLMLGLKALWAVPFAPMHIREAEETLTDTLHIVDGAIAGLLLVVAISVGASALGKRYRVYSIATILVAAVFIAWTGMDGGRLADNLATPWLGIKERTWVYGYQLWFAVFAITLLRTHGRRGDIHDAVKRRSLR